MTGSTFLERAGGRSRVRVGAALTAVPLAVALLGPLFTEPGARGPAFTYGDQWLLGTDSEGRDLLTQVLLGGRSLVLVAAAAVALTYLLAVPWGIAAATARVPIVDEMLMRPLDLLLSLPSIMVLLLAVALTDADLVVLTVTVAVLLFPDAARLVRASALHTAHTPAMEALLLQRETWWRRHLGYLGRSLLPVLAADAGLRFVGAIYLVASASFLGVSADSAGTDWAVMIDRNRAGLALVPWGVVLPAALIIALAMGVNLLFDSGARAATREVSTRKWR
ncbi:ABC transporter permease [Rhodococcus ruber Chol-4]|uniref:Putative ABC transporter permease protein n=1 Tax=Rhodococcus ruber TaxID=1830 RepID=A0A098BQP0_9NOCA|nr:ABC transporter permease subunit [Rhodococcus ruber]MDX5312467.1 ABC transporter permease subunit [Rhodococcus sp. (in: high G+C Gram-positive bacteria)]KXF85890.1 ABC transporter permease [Rhodococcus ruber Chol-4]MBD8053711.1 ABC transporter permease subunit [Rhodococcus ruber]MBP2213294.1 peptide/nickel transport system permease protein [Rhodococcus ruber]MCD2128636.1 ABC transporter permease subunit [Rhodococcus ruber]